MDRRHFTLMILTCLLYAVLPFHLGAEVLAAGEDAQQDTIVLAARSRVPLENDADRVRVVLKRLEWQPEETAIIICDMWDQHWCKGATRRVAELAPQMNGVVGRARKMGVLIIHAPSGTIGHYKDHPARKVAKDAPKAENLPGDIAKWRKWIDDDEENVGYPIDHSDGGCDCEPKCEQGSPWSKQVEAIEIRDNDAISDSGTEIWNLLEQRGIKNVILMGVHTNMCVLGRPFGLRNMSRYGKNVVLMRDMTDTMYNSKMKPVVSHFTGTDLVVEHIERRVCPTVTSTVFTGKPPFVFKEDKRPRVVVISAESEYRAVETMPIFTDLLKRKYGCYCEVIQGSTEKSGPARNWIAGMETLSDADLVIVFARRRAFPADQMQYLRDYLAAGKPLIGLGTASHAFDTRGNAPRGHSEWRNFDPEVLGGNYHGRAAGITVSVSSRKAMKS